MTTENFLQIVLFFVGAVIGVLSQILEPRWQKILLGIVAVASLVISSLWAGYEWGIKEPAPTPDSSGGVFLEQNGEVVIEAEHFTYALPGTGKAVGDSWQPTKGFRDYTGDSALQAVPNTNTNTKLETYGPALLYVIKFQTVGDYYVYVRGYAPSNDDDSLHVGLAGNAVTTSGDVGLTGFSLLKFSWQNHHNGIDTVISVPARGVYSFYLWMREDGMVVDKLWLSTQKDAISNDNTDPGPEESLRTQLGEQ